MGWIRRVRHPLGDVLVAEGEQAVLLIVFPQQRAAPVRRAAWVACCFLNNRRMSRASVLRLARLIYPFIQAELFLPWDADGFVAARRRRRIEFLRRARPARGHAATAASCSARPGQDDDAFQLRVLAHSLLQAFERYYIAIAALVKNGPHTLTGGRTRKRSATLTAQRLSLLNEAGAPEFFDKALFRGFIQHAARAPRRA